MTPNQIEKNVDEIVGTFPTNDQKLQVIQIGLLVEIRELLTKPAIAMDNKPYSNLNRE